MYSEKQLLENCKKGDKPSQYELVKRFSPSLLTVCRRYTRDDAMAKDVLQETLIRIFKNIDSFQLDKPFGPWARQIAVRSSLQWIQKNYFKRESAVEIFHTEPNHVPEVFNNLGTEVILKCIQELPVGYRTVFNLNIIEGYSHKEIGELLDISEGTSRSQLNRARRLLQTKLTDLQKRATI